MNSNCCEWFGKRKPWKIAGMIIGGILLAGLMAFLFGWVVMLLWNWIMPSIFGLTTITYWQGFGIFFLAKILFGFGGGSSDSDGGSKKKNKEGTVRGEIGKGIREEIRKEFKKEFDKEYKEEFEEEMKKEFGKEFNEEYDEKYEQWWENEGKAAFNEYMREKKETTDTEA